MCTLYISVVLVCVYLVYVSVVSTMLSVESSGQREGCGPKYPMIKGYGEMLYLLMSIPS